MEKLAIVGSYNQDITFCTPRIPLPGETVKSTGFFTGSGGKGSNQIIAAHLQGGAPAAVIKVGDDEEGRAIRSLYQKLGIPTDGMLTDPQEHTGVAGIFIDEQGRNCIVVHGGANGTLSSNEILNVLPDDVTLAGFQLENDCEETFAAIRALSARGVKIMLDPAPARPLPDWLFPCLTFLKPNEFEAATLTGMPVTNRQEAERAADALLARGTKNVIVTLGEKGCVIRGTVNAFIPAIRMKAVDTTGAGDIFAGTMLARIAGGDTLERAVQLASAASALSVTKKGVWQSCPTEQETRAFEQQHRSDAEERV
ncbi:MAG TPA: ribokinase [Candidatus Limiplasma sp.]|nr:ribokinase [Candidatus Limiplasma sp.]